jgi:hypothetical protein
MSIQPGSSVNPALTTPWSRRVVENDEFSAFARRVLRAAGRRVADGDVDALPELAALAVAVDETLGQAVAGLRAVGYLWAEIAGRLGVTRQAAHQRWSATSVASTEVAP